MVVGTTSSKAGKGVPSRTQLLPRLPFPSLWVSGGGDGVVRT